MHFTLLFVTLITLVQVLENGIVAKLSRLIFHKMATLIVKMIESND